MQVTESSVQTSKRAGDPKLTRKKTIDPSEGGRIMSNRRSSSSIKEPPGRTRPRRKPGSRENTTPIQKVLMELLQKCKKSSPQTRTRIPQVGAKTRKPSKGSRNKDARSSFVRDDNDTLSTQVGKVVHTKRDVRQGLLSKHATTSWTHPKVVYELEEPLKHIMKPKRSSSRSRRGSKACLKHSNSSNSTLDTASMTASFSSCSSDMNSSSSSLVDYLRDSLHDKSSPERTVAPGLQPHQHIEKMVIIQASCDYSSHKPKDPEGMSPTTGSKASVVMHPPPIDVVPSDMKSEASCCHDDDDESVYSEDVFMESSSSRRSAHDGDGENDNLEVGTGTTMSQQDEERQNNSDQFTTNVVVNMPYHGKEQQEEDRRKDNRRQASWVRAAAWESKRTLIRKKRTNVTLTVLGSLLVTGCLLYLVYSLGMLSDEQTQQVDDAIDDVRTKVQGVLGQWSGDDESSGTSSGNADDGSVRALVENITAHDEYGSTTASQQNRTITKTIYRHHDIPIDISWWRTAPILLTLCCCLTWSKAERQIVEEEKYPDAINSSDEDDEEQGQIHTDRSN